MAMAEHVTAAAGGGEELLSLAETAKVLGVSQRTAQRLLDREELKATKVGRQWRFRREDLSAYLNRERAPFEMPMKANLDAALAQVSGVLGDLDAELAGFEPAGGAVGEDDVFPEPVLRLAHSLIVLAIREGASDLHLQPGREETRLRLRVDGVLHDAIDRLPGGVHEAVVSRFKQMAEMHVTERRLPQDGRARVRYEGKEYELRINCLPVLRGEKLVARILDRSSVLIGLIRLGMLPETMAALEDLIHRQEGLVLVTGPTGAGKSTTLYSLLYRLNDKERHLLTVEDPVEYELPGVSQVAVQRQIGLTWSAAVHTLFRQDPDVMMVAQIRDLETADLVVEAALTGHLALAGMHTPDAPSAFTRLVDMGVAPFLLAGAVTGVVAQRLVRRLCEACRQQASLDPEARARALQLAGGDGEGLSADALFYERPALGSPFQPEEAFFYCAAGCDQCRNTGYRGRIGLFELLLPRPRFREAVVRRASAEELRAIAIEEGMKTLAVDGLRKAAAGFTTVEEVLRVV
jgi:excisionase family DNA binding protein